MTKKGGKLKCIEPQGDNLIDANPNVRRFFVQARWHPFCSRLGSFHLGVAKEFSLSFDGQEANVYVLKLRVSTESIASAFHLPQEGEKWFKSQVITGGNLNSFIKN